MVHKDRSSYISHPEKAWTWYAKSLSEFGKKSSFGIFEKKWHSTHLIKLVDKIFKYEVEEDTEHIFKAHSLFRNEVVQLSGVRVLVPTPQGCPLHWFIKDYAKVHCIWYWQVPNVVFFNCDVANKFSTEVVMTMQLADLSCIGFFQLQWGFLEAFELIEVFV